MNVVTGQYNANIEKNKCCDDDDKSIENEIISSGHNDDVNNVNDHSTKSVELSFVLDRYRSNDTFSKPSSSCTRIMFESLLTAVKRNQSVSSSKVDANRVESPNEVNGTVPKYIVYCNRTNIDDFLSETIDAKSTTNRQSSISDRHSNREMLSGIILINVPLNGDGNPWQQENAHNSNNAMEYLSWTQSRLTSELLRRWQTFDHLTHLDFGENDLTTLTWDMFEHFPKLRALNLSNNAIRSETIQHMLFNRFTQLQHLDLSNNKIMSIVYERLHELAPMPMNVNVRNHKLFSNQFSSALNNANGMFVNMPELRELILSHNQIIDLPRNSFAINGLPKLNSLNLAHNSLSIIPFQIFQPLVALQKLDLSSNRLVSILDNFFIENTALTELNVHDNTIEKLLENSLQGLMNLIELDLSLNQMKNIHRNAFDGLNALERLNLCRNNLFALPTTLFHRLYQLKYLNLSQNKFKTLYNGVFANQFALEHLIIDETLLEKTNNWISQKPNEVNKDILKCLRVISLQNNLNLREIDPITLRSLPAVEYFHLSGNRLVVLPHEIDELTELKYLDISKNDLISIPRQLYTLKHLDSINMLGNSYECDCQMVWLTAWIHETRTRAINTTSIEKCPPFNQLNQLSCRHGYPGDLLRVLQNLQCSKPTAVHVSDSKTYLLRSDAQLECSFIGNPVPDIIWVTPLNNIIHYFADPDVKPLPLAHDHQNSINRSDTSQIDAKIELHARNREKIEHQFLKHTFDRFTSPEIGANEVTLLENGSLRVHNISRKDSGVYSCYGYNVMGYKSAEIR